MCIHLPQCSSTERYRRYHYPIGEMVCKSKISCVTWSAYHKNMLASVDYEATITLWDAFTGQKTVQSLSEPVPVGQRGDVFVESQWAVTAGSPGAHGACGGRVWRS